MFHQTKKTLSILSYNDLADECFQLVVNTFSGYELNHESPPFSINNAKDVTSSLINVFTAFQNPKYHDNHNKPVIWIRRLIKAHNVDYIKGLIPGINTIHAR